VGAGAGAAGVDSWAVGVGVERVHAARPVARIVSKLTISLRVSARRRARMGNP
jgi:hypothetical protein